MRNILILSLCLLSFTACAAETKAMVDAEPAEGYATAIIPLHSTHCIDITNNQPHYWCYGVVYSIDTEIGKSNVQTKDVCLLAGSRVNYCEHWVNNFNGFDQEKTYHFTARTKIFDPLGDHVDEKTQEIKVTKKR